MLEIAFEAKMMLIEGNRSIKIANVDSDMINSLEHRIPFGLLARGGSGDGNHLC